MFKIGDTVKLLECPWGTECIGKIGTVVDTFYTKKFKDITIEYYDIDNILVHATFKPNMIELIND